MLRSERVSQACKHELSLMWRHRLMRFGIIGSALAGVCCVGVLVVIGAAAVVGGSTAWAASADNTVDTVVLPIVGVVLAVLVAVWFMRFRRGVACDQGEATAEPHPKE